jgi:hypothetical protein
MQGSVVFLTRLSNITLGHTGGLGIVNEPFQLLVQGVEQRAHLCVCVCACVCVCVCVSERERERERVCVCV